MAKGKGSFWAAGFQDDLNKDVSIITALCLNLDWQNMKRMVNGNSSFWAAGFQDDLNKDVSIITALCLNLDWHNLKKW